MKPFSACVVFALLGYYQCEANPSGVAKWAEFKAKHGKQHSGVEEKERMKRFLERDAEIVEHNKKFARGEVSFSRGHNKYSDMNGKDFKKFAFGLRLAKNDSIPFAVSMPSGPLPDSFDWRDQGAVSPVKDQGQCGSCYAFAATGLIESYLLRKGQGAMDVSEQDAVDCSYNKYPVETPDGPGMANLGCDGGVSTIAIQYFVENGLVDEASYPYTSGDSEKKGTCNRPAPSVTISDAQPHTVQVTDETQMAQLLVSKGPLFIGIAAGDDNHRQFSQTKDGIFDLPEAATSAWEIHHGVLLVGYGSDNGRDFWVIKNSWGTNDFGVGGFGRISRGNNMCRLTEAPVVYIE